MKGKETMATIINTMDRVVSNSRKQNRIMNILYKSFVTGSIGYVIFILTITGFTQLISSVFNQTASQNNSTILLSSSALYLCFYTFMLIKEMKRNNFCK
ncbi:MAG: hypothetical protein HXY50_13330 [Ignavibacteriaceae bacterium]|nr:hypothetical protein [Ignavibacteriaceae bacterium]